MLAPPCDTFTTARDRSCQVRSRDHPYGVPGLSEHWRKVVDDANTIVGSCFRIFRRCHRLGIPAIVENPRSSRLWLTDECLDALQLPGVDFFITDCCAHGTKWRKATGFLTTHVDCCDAERLQKRCHARGGICQYSGRKHLQLTGTAPGGTSWTRIAQAYPKRLAHHLAFCLTGASRDVG